MAERGGFNTEQSKEGERSYWETLLWRRAEEIAERREVLLTRREAIYAELNDGQPASLRDLDKDQKLHKEYWQCDRSLNETQAIDDEIQEFLSALAEGHVDEARLRKFLGIQEEEKIQTAPARVNPGDELYWFDYDRYFDQYAPPQKLISEPTRLTTGRHQRHVKGSFDAATAAEAFHYYTADTHGGKVKPGKRGDGTYYRSKGGKKIRKK